MGNTLRVRVPFPTFFVFAKRRMWDEEPQMRNQVEHFTGFERERAEAGVLLTSDEITKLEWVLFYGRNG